MHLLIQSALQSQYSVQGWTAYQRNWDRNLIYLGLFDPGEFVIYTLRKATAALGLLKT